MSMEIQTTADKVNQGIRDLKEKGATVHLYEDNTGSVSMSGVKATFAFKNDILTVNIKDTPFLVSESYVENQIRSYFE